MIYSSFASHNVVSTRDAYLITNPLFLSPYLLLHLLIQPLNFFVMRIRFAILTRKRKNNVHNSERLLASAIKVPVTWVWKR